MSTLHDKTGLTEDQAAEVIPVLLAALVRSLSWLSSYPGGGTLYKNGPYEQARAAIKAATE
ncbi:MAG: hypothetical protein Q7J84_10585 [Sulfuricaulis sp.]|nr:hypothetical protein [Sulfuricaulis sp.]